MAQTELERRAYKVSAMCAHIENLLARRPGALPPGEHRTVMDMLNDVAMQEPLLRFAPADRQVDAALGFLALWDDLLDDQTDHLWPDPDDREDQ